MKKDYITVENMTQHVSEAINLFRKKNAAYGNSVERSIQKFGYVAALVRISDKLERLITLLEHPDLDQFGESLIDTATDLGVYSHMLAVYLKGEVNEARSKSTQVSDGDELRSDGTGQQGTESGSQGSIPVGDTVPIQGQRAALPGTYADSIRRASTACSRQYKLSVEERDGNGAIQ